MIKRLLICAGGTGGHIYPAASVIKKVKENAGEIELGFIGSVRDEGLKTIKKIEARKYFMRIRSFERRPSLSWIPSFFSLIRAFFSVMGYIRNFNPDAVLGFGGYVSAPVMLASLVLRIPYMIHEQNLVPGRANRMFARFAKVFFASFAETRDYLPERVTFVCTGNPIKYSGWTSKEEARADFGLDVDRITVGLFGGSRGSASINGLVFGYLGRMLLAREAQILHIAGFDERRLFEGDRYIRMDYLEDMQNFYSACDLIICRAGASTIAELKHFRKPAVLIPYPYAVGDHQQRNAEHLARAGCAIVLNDLKMSADMEKHADLIADLAFNEEKIERMEASYSIFGDGIDPALKIVEEIYRIN
ncbi:MAG: UDP-N-acetylglucosamine--N-acetylmuramyl-(pentapeptide) pyrophosphoryl-undecaprenol N-acetylglucosamine transferase [Actinobacteria bacterium]|nr:UDP-N-acetylglucosamine--N-acetylmuramyl-(pentapeptide) pyrophosphoryl-undecaprenol N-acetylglucosamine transferase [Actinomycetota bacterium]